MNVLDLIEAQLDGIIYNADRMTSGNYMHNKNAIKYMAEMVKEHIQILVEKGNIDLSEN